LEKKIIPVFSPKFSKFTFIVFFAVFGDIPQSEPCLKQICLSDSSETNLHPFSTNAFFIFGYASSIFKLIVRASKGTPQPNKQREAIVVFHRFYKGASDTATT